MIHEFKAILRDASEAKKAGIKTVLASVVDLDGSSYRRPGVRMLVREDGRMTGAVSGGCVEQEVFRQSAEVFQKGTPKMMTYDGRYRLGCEGILYILLEPLDASTELIKAFDDCLKFRKSFQLISYYKNQPGQVKFGGTLALFEADFTVSISATGNIKRSASVASLKCFNQTIHPRTRLIIFGAEHDAAQLSMYAAFTGWEVTIIVPSDNTKTQRDFPGAHSLLHLDPYEMDRLKIDGNTAVVLMYHNFARDFKYLIWLTRHSPAYIGLLGSAKRRNKLIDALIAEAPQVEHHWIDLLYGPAGINIGAETPQEIAISIISEILTVIRDQHPISLRDKRGSIHDKLVASYL